MKGEADVIELLVDGHGVNPGVLTEVKIDKRSMSANIFFYLALTDFFRMAGLQSFLQYKETNLMWLNYSKIITINLFQQQQTLII